MRFGSCNPLKKSDTFTVNIINQNLSGSRFHFADIDKIKMTPQRQ